MSSSTNSNADMNNNIVASQSSQFISIVPENGEQFNPQQKIIYNIEPEIGYIKKDSYLVFDVLNNSATPMYYTFQGNAGIHAIIDDVNIYAKETGVLLESIQNYNQLASILTEYKYDDHTPQIVKSGLCKKNWTKDYVLNAAGAAPQIHSVVPTHDNLEDCMLSPMSDDTTNAPKFYTRRFMLHLNSGLLGAYTSSADEKIIPIVNFGGLRIEINLASANRALELLQGHVSIPGIPDNAPTNVVPLSNNPRALGVGAGANNVPGWRVCSDNAGAVAQINAGANSIFIDLRDLNATAVFDTSEIGIGLGQQIEFWNYTNPAAPVRIGNQALTIGGSTPIGNPSVVNGRNRYVGFSLNLSAATADILNAGGAVNTRLLLATATPSYRVMKSEFRLLQVVPPPQVAASLMKGVNYEFTSYETFLDNIPATTLRHQIPLNSIASKALCVLTHIFDSQAIDDVRIANPYFHALTPQETLNNSIVFFINNRLYPLRAYDPSTKSDYVLTINECVKALNAMGLNPQKLGNNERNNLEGYTNSFLIARELSRNGFVFDLRNAEPEIRLGFSGARNNVLRANSFVFSKKIVQTTANGVQLIN